MQELVDVIRQRSDCRSPLVFHEDSLTVSNKTPLEFVEDVAGYLSAHVEAFHCDQEDDEQRVGRRVDATIAAGDWLVVTFSTAFPVSKFLRFVGRRMMTMMPDAERRPNLELFRLWLCLPPSVEQPALFKQVAIAITTEMMQHAEQRPAAQRRISAPVKEDNQHEEGETTDSEHLADKKVGPLFHRRLELSSGKTPQSTQTLATTVNQAKRVQSAAPLRILGTSKSASDVKRPQSCAGVQDTLRQREIEAEREFEVKSSTAVQAVHSALLQTHAFSKETANRMLKHVEAIGRTPQLAANDGIPGGRIDDLELGDVMGYSDDRSCTFRLGMWRWVPCLVEQMSDSHCTNTAADLIHLRFTLRHPFLLTPLALLRERDYAYLISELPTQGPVPMQLRNHAATGPPPMRYIANIAKCVCVALLHLHKEGYVHRDLMAQHLYDMGHGQFRLLLTHRLQRLDASGFTTTANIPTRWSSPDALTTGNYAPYDDIWAFGSLMWELLSGAREAPFSDLLHNDDIPAVLLQGRRLRCPAGADPMFWDRIVAPCFARNEYRAHLKHLYENICEYISHLDGRADEIDAHAVPL